ncbi:hypothetical protein GCK32_013467 [Trichostrongylus colubriformis]|uniref:Uncharacterized protein n=1 Tax=Trichostrongylus colubriformis TaxID=6319 RepID=A0AAN8FNE8_TRICO
MPVKMFYTTALSLIFLLTARAQLQGPFGIRPFDWSSFNPYNAFQRGPFDFDWFSGISSWVEQTIKNAMSMIGDYGTAISTANGTTTVTAMIAGKRYTATFPEGTTIYTNTFISRKDGRSNEVFQITVNGESYTYKTADGQTTVTDSKGKELPDGGPFHVTSTQNRNIGIHNAPYGAY